MWEDIGLILFVVIIGILSPVTLLWDLYLRLTGQQMITQYVRKNPWAALLIYVLLAIGVGGLMVHFMGTN